MAGVDQRIVPIILAGGKGTRLWPISRSARPKQFLSLAGDNSLFQQTLTRVSDSEKFAAPIVITNNEYRFLVAEQAQEAGIELGGILLEPVARNTTAAVLAAAKYMQSLGGEDTLMFVLASDHRIVEDANYVTAVDAAAKCALNGNLVTFGIKPTEPAIGYGYIEQGDAIECGGHKVVKFVEKPALALAEQLVAGGKHLWNSGMFLFDRDVIISECEKLAPDVASAVAGAVDNADKDLDFVRLNEDAFAQSPDISIDYAIFEKTDKAAVVPSPFEWSDLGSWDAVWKVGAQDNEGNVSVGDVMLSETKNSLVYSETGQVTVSGLDDVAVIVSEDAIFVGALSEAQKVGELVKKLRSDKRTAPLTETHRTCYRPWGGYSSLVVGNRFQVKRLFVKPGKKLSLQKHHHRSEHWVVVSGTAEVTIDDSVKTLSENQSVYIPLGAVHRLENKGKILLELIEVQTGSYLGEDDIVRLEDEFGRA
ncbi:mannose-1-phosphate guanylyltransferase/mannose-6-phosphate isomerase [Maritalea porphyrae]|jgi:mannose-1-phosphate guanylyltransferase|uniref:mannose-1-phosphate guanylyltransferase/mannose-6-phosphate isomerase n=1 Tax=Maritalea porphyrae TaxID=880732 RepID=UPI0022AED377|nr:mannose-1-phosphate guanylyltransferase/mannose-6-phosphate isomerase [Maritalea porphyrae]MCZ4272771.1 mannose-1-phosphate guanylyltransferase/mannose-6-phosphate isomerase [Maritalea porphyrae]